ncbi:hypothetical protein J6590_085095 [Homalodisca vitripennis]|nr:hypothetical protein J6590_085095 [Homalodisca vitripennis]
MDTTTQRGYFNVYALLREMKKKRSDGMEDQKGSLPPLTVQTTRHSLGELVDELPNTTQCAPQIKQPNLRSPSRP